MRRFLFALLASLALLLTASSSANATANWGFGWNTYDSPTVMPSADWRPYRDQSPWNRVVTASPPLYSNSAGIMSRFNNASDPANYNAGPSKLNAGPDPAEYEHPTYWSRPTDPLVTLHCTRAWGTCEFEGEQIRIPAAAQPANGGDHHMTVWPQGPTDGPGAGWEYSFYDVEGYSGSTLNVGWGGKDCVFCDGRDANSTAAWFPNTAGIIRAQEMRAGHIDHALFMVVKCTNGTSVWPAGTGAGTACSSLRDANNNPLSNTNAPPMGARFQLNMTWAEIDALSVPTWKKIILKAMSKYGMYVGDTGGGGWNIQFEASQTYTSFGLPDDMATYGAEQGVTLYNGQRIFDLRPGVDWTKLRVLSPCTAVETATTACPNPPY